MNAEKNALEVFVEIKSAAPIGEVRMRFVANESTGILVKQSLTLSVMCPVAYFTKEVTPSLAKLPFEFRGLAKLGYGLWWTKVLECL